MQNGRFSTNPNADLDKNPFHRSERRLWRLWQLDLLLDAVQGAGDAGERVGFEAESLQKRDE